MAEEGAEVGGCLGVVGLECDGLAEGGLRLRQLPLVAQGGAEVRVCLVVVGLECDGLAVGGLRLRYCLPAQDEALQTIRNRLKAGGPLDFKELVDLF